MIAFSFVLLVSVGLANAARVARLSNAQGTGTGGGSGGASEDGSGSGVGRAYGTGTSDGSGAHARSESGGSGGGVAQTGGTAYGAGSGVGSSSTSRSWGCMAQDHILVPVVQEVEVAVVMQSAVMDLLVLGTVVVAELDQVMRTYIQGGPIGAGPVIQVQRQMEMVVAPVVVMLVALVVGKGGLGVC